MQPIFSPSSSSTTTSPTSPFVQINNSNNDNNEKLNVFDQTMLEYLIFYENSKPYLLQVINVFVSKAYCILIQQSFEITFDYICIYIYMNNYM